MLDVLKAQLFKEANEVQTEPKNNPKREGAGDSKEEMIETIDLTGASEGALVEMKRQKRIKRKRVRAAGEEIVETIDLTGDNELTIAAAWPVKKMREDWRAFRMNRI